MKTLIITGCIAPMDKRGVILNVDERLEQYLDSIKFYLERAEACKLDEIIYCDNSNYQIKSDVLEQLMSLSSVPFKWIAFQGDKELVKKHGKGIGEGEILDYATSHTESDIIIKVTGRLKVDNIIPILKRVKNGIYFNPDLYWSYNDSYDTRLFACSTDYYKKVISNIYRKVDEINGKGIEPLLYAELSQKDVKCFPHYPRFTGRCGGFGFEYSDEKRARRFMLEILARFGLLKYSVPFKIVRKILGKLKLWK